MALDPVIVEISSDEEGDWDEYDDQHIDWLSEYLDDDTEVVDVSDDVVILDELSTSKKQGSLPVKPKEAVSSGKLGDDDCLILDGDPDEILPKMNAAEDGSLDDLLIVGEKGEVACRDFAHPRHDCVKFPFSSTSHAKHCDLCHCYVCDIRAPCVYWGTGQLKTDHCHSTDKEERWKADRRALKRGRTPAPPVVKKLEAPLSMTSSRVGTIVSQAPSSSSGSVHLQSFPKTSCATQTMLNHRHSSPLGYGHGASLLPQYPTRSRSDQVLKKYNIYKEGSRNGALGPQVVNQGQRFKRVGAHTNNAFKTMGMYGSSNNNTPSVVGNGNVSKLQELLAGLDSEMATFSKTPQTNNNWNSANFSAYSICPQQAHSPDFPQLNVNTNGSAFENLPIWTNTNCSSSDYRWPNATSQNNIQHLTGNSAVVNALASMAQAGSPVNNQPPPNVMVDFDAASWTFSFLDVPSQAESATGVTPTGDIAAPLQPATFPDYEGSWGTLA
ncbi:RPM1 interacting protein 13-like [Aristolochia californica]|uniref:RPM1 interacting protein 13-like n=1 Tax=Aristolochia californica TaxID=171875 RepID=UPI0035DB7425